MNRLLVVTFLVTIGIISVQIAHQCAAKVGMGKYVDRSKANCFNLCQLEMHKVIVNGSVHIPHIQNAQKNCVKLKEDDKCVLANRLKRCLQVSLNRKELEEFDYIYLI
uniref:ACP157a n=1 Tax=Drosophila yakuba TaxID=7245 RepID=Q20DK3_DROYA|nr:ACP157a [Drosophila yakuba]